MTFYNQVAARYSAEDPSTMGMELQYFVEESSHQFRDIEKTTAIWRCFGTEYVQAYGMGFENLKKINQQVRERCLESFRKLQDLYDYVDKMYPAITQAIKGKMIKTNSPSIP